MSCAHKYILHKKYLHSEFSCQIMYVPKVYICLKRKHKPLDKFKDKKNPEGALTRGCELWF